MSTKKVSGAGSRPRYSPEFKADAVAMVIDGDRTISDVAKSLGLVDQTLGNWVRQARIDRGERAGLTTDERAELTRLRRENAQLSMERDLLKRATAFWVQESAR
ncbi:MAG: transposase [Actinomycetes bacterium]